MLKKNQELRTTSQNLQLVPFSLFCGKNERQKGSYKLKIAFLRNAAGVSISTFLHPYHSYGMSRFHSLPLLSETPLRFAEIKTRQ